MEAQARPIGVFDSGLGGISVLRACVRLLPQENFLFFGDSANAPYGEKSLDQVRALTLSAGEDPALTLRLSPGQNVLDTAMDLVEDLRLAGTENSGTP